MIFQQHRLALGLDPGPQDASLGQLNAVGGCSRNTHGGVPVIAPGVMALAVAFAQCMQQGAGQEITAAPLAVVHALAATEDSGTPFCLSALGIVWMFSLFLTFFGGWKARAFCDSVFSKKASPPAHYVEPRKKRQLYGERLSDEDWDRQLDAQRRVEHAQQVRARAVDRAVQAQTTFKWWWTTPRFAPLQDASHGCFNGDS